MGKVHGWLTGALADVGYQQQDLATAWGVDSAVVSRFINTGKPDLTPERQMLLSQILGLTNDQLLNKLYPDPVRRLVKPPQSAQPTDATDAEIRRCLERIRDLLPGAKITINIIYDKE
jgi:hypothetical protein